ncbi:MAG: hypothetical protein WBU92_01340 [Candidatus Dormiibacterota bacterium]
MRLPGAGLRWPSRWDHVGGRAARSTLWVAHLGKGGIVEGMGPCRPELRAGEGERGRASGAVSGGLGGEPTEDR